MHVIIHKCLFHKWPRLQPTKEQPLFYSVFDPTPLPWKLISGLFFVLPCIESYQKVDLRTITLDVPPQEVSHGTKFCSFKILLLLWQYKQKTVNAFSSCTHRYIISVTLFSISRVCETALPLRTSIYIKFKFISHDHANFILKKRMINYTQYRFWGHSKNIVTLWERGSSA